MRVFDPFELRGRLGRLQYFGFGAVWALVVLVVGLAIGGGPGDPVGLGGAFAILGLMLLFFAATVSYGVRRLHDLGKSGWWYLLAFVPVANVAMALILLFAPGTPGPNPYGVR